MAHPDEGYLIPDELWEGREDPETGENVYPDDEFAERRLALLREWKERQEIGQRYNRRRPASTLADVR